MAVGEFEMCTAECSLLPVVKQTIKETFKLQCISAQVMRGWKLVRI